MKLLQQMSTFVSSYLPLYGHRSVVLCNVVGYYTVFPADLMNGLPEASGTRAINTLVKLMYVSSFWMAPSECQLFVSAGEHFLAASSRVAVLFFQKKESRFPVTPKHHMLYHTVKQVSWQYDLVRPALNPVAESCSMDEDYVGRIARVARSVSPRAVCLRTLQRYLLQVREVWYN